MTFYIIMQWDDKKGWNSLDDFGPGGYIKMKYKMQELRKGNPGIKYRLQKTYY